MARKRHYANRRAYVCSSLAEFIDTATDITDAWVKEEGRRFRPWFRGHSRIAWKLVPGFYRPQYAALDEWICRRHFSRRAYPYLAAAAALPGDEWEWYFLMQHYGFPTRLLDWTESALIGLFFAVRDKPSRGGAAVWMLDPWRFNEVVAKQGNNVFFWTDNQISEYLPPSEGFDRMPKSPLALRPPHTSVRVAAQQAAFTIHGRLHREIAGYSAIGDRLKKIHIPAASVNRIYRELEIAGITETSIFPELPSVGRELLRYFLPGE
jgi:hypothetical protein